MLLKPERIKQREYIAILANIKGLESYLVASSDDLEIVDKVIILTLSLQVTHIYVCDERKLAIHRHYSSILSYTTYRIHSKSRTYDQS